MEILAAADHRKLVSSTQLPSVKPQSLFRFRLEKVDVLVPDTEKTAQFPASGIAAGKTEIVLVDVCRKKRHDQNSAILHKTAQALHDSRLHHEQHRRDQYFISGKVACAFNDSQRDTVRPERLVMLEHRFNHLLLLHITAPFAKSFRIVQRPDGLPVVNHRDFGTDHAVRNFADPLQACPVAGDALKHQGFVRAVMPDHGAVEFFAVAAPLPPLKIHGSVGAVGKRKEHFTLELPRTAHFAVRLVIRDAGTGLHHQERLALHRIVHVVNHGIPCGGPFRFPFVPRGITVVRDKIADIRDAPVVQSFIYPHHIGGDGRIGKVPQRLHLKTHEVHNLLCVEP